MDEQDEKLHQLLDLIRQSPSGSLEWRRSLGRLLLLIQKFPEFRKYTHSGCPPYYLDALNRTLEWLSREIHNFQPRPNSSIRSDLVKWVNGYLYWRLKDAATAGTSEWQSLDEPIYEFDAATRVTAIDQLADQRHVIGQGNAIPGLSGLERYIEQLEHQSEQQVVNQLEVYIEQDPEERLRRCYPRRHPECNGQLLSQRRCLKDPPDSLAELAREFDLNYQTMVSHWKLKVVPLLQEIAIELGHQPH
jgi:hypothetical protein